MSSSTEKCAVASQLCGQMVWREGELAFVRKLGTSNVAMLTFVGRKVRRYVHYNCECTVAREYKRTIPACYRCRTIGHRQDNCPHPIVSRCGYCGQRVRASEHGVSEHECTPLCFVCGEAPLTGSADCKEKFRRLQRPGIQTHGGPGKKTSKPSGNKDASSGKPLQANRPAAGNKMSNKNLKASGKSVKPPALQEGDFPPFANSNTEITYKLIASKQRIVDLETSDLGLSSEENVRAFPTSLCAVNVIDKCGTPWSMVTTSSCDDGKLAGFAAEYSMLTVAVYLV
ncbi:hypothetical protein HPB50_011582 [Hyalomma asiaticum]|uniref:Uncharacterized protein n=1 Tax=Hyalomma asiaticum TaxID=266040 RepID=A0ACB7TG66_HYAAI|nr:hypothetical protein HPB50_011582 [Hyalomma asiaticum]